MLNAATTAEIETLEEQRSRLAPRERECLEGALKKLGDQARAFIQQEKVLAQRKRKR